MNVFDTPAPQTESIFSMGIEEQGKAYLLQTVRWTKFLAIMGFIFTGLLFVVGIVALVMNNSDIDAATGISTGYMTALRIGVLFGYMLAAALYIYPVIMLLQFSNAAKKGLTEQNQQQLTTAFRYQRNMYRYIGWLLIIVLALYIIFFIAIFALRGF